MHFPLQLANIELRIKKNPCSSIYNLVHLKKEEITLSWLGMKVLESFAGHAKNILGRHYLRAEV